MRNSGRWKIFNFARILLGGVLALELLLLAGTYSILRAILTVPLALAVIYLWRLDRFRTKILARAGVASLILAALVHFYVGWAIWGHSDAAAVVFSTIGLLCVALAAS